MAALRQTTIVCDVGSVAADAITVDALAWLQLRARRAGFELRFGNASSELLDLLEFTGLRGPLRVELQRQPEERKQRLGVEEERELDDPAF